MVGRRGSEVDFPALSFRGLEDYEGGCHATNLIHHSIYTWEALISDEFSIELGGRGGRVQIRGDWLNPYIRTSR